MGGRKDHLTELKNSKRASTHSNRICAMKLFLIDAIRVFQISNEEAMKKQDTNRSANQNISDRNQRAQQSSASALPLPLPQPME